MGVHDVVLRPPFNITRAGHIVLGATDLEASTAFYTQAVGLVVSRRTADTVYLRGLEEVCHHSLKLVKTPAAVCQRIGLRVQTDDDVLSAKDYFDARGVSAEIVEVEHQGMTLHVSDSIGTPLELCATMDAMPRLLGRYDLYGGGCAQRLDHFQIAAYDVAQATEFYSPLGFRCSEYTYSVDASGNEVLWGAWLQRKGNPHDVVLTNGIGPRLHHFAYTIRDAHDLIHLVDTMGALGNGAALERGPGRHGMGGGALFVYLLDPDGHRIELFNTHYQAIDLDPPIGWDLADPRRADLWGLPARSRWFVEASEFDGVPTQASILKADPPTLERLLAVKSASIDVAEKTVAKSEVVV